MKTFLAQSGWLQAEGYRLDASAFAEGGLESRDHITRGSWPWKRLDHLCRIFMETRFARRYVADPSRGVPCLTGSDMLLVDLRGLLYLSLRNTPQMPRLLIEEGWTLMSRSGTIGRTVFVRGDMRGMAASDDVIRVVADSADILPGYLFSFLNSARAQAIIKQKTYGSVVQHIEPHQIADLPIPLMDEKDQQRVDGLVNRAASARAEASRLLDDAGIQFDRLAGPMVSKHDHARSVGIIQSSSLRNRLDAFYNVGWAAEPGLDQGDRIDSLGSVISTARVPRTYAERGVPFLSGIDIFRLRPVARALLAPYVTDAFNARVRAGDLAVQGSGQRYGLLGRVSHIGNRLDKWAASHDLFRIRTGDPRKTARIYAYLNSESGHRSMLRHSYGTSIPHVNPDGIAALRVPRVPDEVASMAERALSLREEADETEEKAIREVETWLG